MAYRNRSADDGKPGAGCEHGRAQADELVMLGALAAQLGMPPGEVLRFAVRRLWGETTKPEASDGAADAQVRQRDDGAMRSESE
jgi:hypothetical protein